MQEKNFKFKKSFGMAISAMDDRTAGKFIKSICEYAFENKLPDSKDKTLRSAFALVRVAIDEEKKDKMYGKIGGLKSAEVKKQQKSVIDIMVGKTSVLDPVDILKTIVKDEPIKTKKQV